MQAFYETAKLCETKGEGYVLATVIRALAPTSAKPGDKAVVTEEGIVHGWIGGSCAEPTVRDEARRALVDGQCRVVQITPKPGPSTDREGLVVVPMTCYSGGELEIYLEPHLAKAELLVFGNSPVAQALVQMGSATGYRVSLVDVTERPALTGADAVFTDLARVALKRPSQAAVVVATHGVFDEDAIECGVALGAAYLGVVASPRRFASLRSTMKARGVSAQAWDMIDGPAGIDIGARTPQEIAVSVIAAITARRESISVTTRRLDSSEPVSEGPSAPASVAEGSPTGGCCHD
jgi:xanthine dehydrogenase accessory factor